MGPGFFEDHLDAANVVGVPHDSAEGYMFDFAINLAVLKHLQATNALNLEKSLLAMDYMKSSELCKWSKKRIFKICDVHLVIH